MRRHNTIVAVLEPVPLLRPVFSYVGNDPIKNIAGEEEEDEGCDEKRHECDDILSE